MWTNDKKNKIEALVDKMTDAKKEINGNRFVSKPCSDAAIVHAEKVFSNKFHHPFPDAYQCILRKVNGINFDGLTIWPAKPEPLFKETMLKANLEMREYFFDGFIYFGQIDEELYVFDIKKRNIVQ